MSTSFKEIKGLTWIRKNSPLPHSTATLQFNQDSAKIFAGQVEKSTSDLSEWFDAKNEIEVYEDVVGLGKIGQTLTLLYGMELPDEDNEDEDDLIESWTPRFRR